jgi:hypothetical protein
MTHGLHDAKVCTLINHVKPSRKTYDEVAHRMWRSRNYSTLDKTFSALGDLLVEVSAIIPKATT